MQIRCGYEMVFELPGPTPMLLALNVHPCRQADLLHPDPIRTEPEIPVERYVDGFGNPCARIVAPAGRLRLWTDTVARDSGLPDPVVPDAQEVCVADLPTEALQFLLGSRYCEVDSLSDTAWRLFGHTPRGWHRVQAVVEWVHRHVTFGYEFARSTKTAREVLGERCGVCRDFQHLAITFCRALGIPARYATGYLGDIGVDPNPNPMDFSAWFEAYLGGRWYTFDARHNRPRIGRILMATGRDATDVALTTSFGSATLTSFRVWTGLLGDPRLPEMTAPAIEGEEEALHDGEIAAASGRR